MATKTKSRSTKSGARKSTSSSRSSAKARKSAAGASARSKAKKSGKASGGRCWPGFKPVKGKKPFSKGSCKKA